jgi:hypothetical protein
MSCLVFIIKEIWRAFDKERTSSTFNNENTAADCCVGPPIHTATADTHMHDADTSQ